MITLVLYDNNKDLIVKHLQGFEVFVPIIKMAHFPLRPESSEYPKTMLVNKLEERLSIPYNLYITAETNEEY